MSDNLPARAAALPLEMPPLNTVGSVRTLLSRGLWQLLTGDGEWEGAVRVIRLNKQLSAELDEKATEVVRRARPVQVEELMFLLLGKKALYGLGDLTPAQADAVFESYTQALAHQPLEAIEEAFRRWDRNEAYPDDPKRHAFFPKPAELNKLAEPHRLLLAKAAFRAKKAYEAPPAAPPPKERMTKDELVASGWFERDSNGNLRAVLDKKPPAPGKTHAAGESPQQMADRLRTQAEPDPPEEAF